ncbi:hypothetical protein BCR36DRAFT_416786 [Piromyces finnis]|uniref:Myb-like domain-containing protein n=1 Tax=Piromyces finnis TaxID=1754191 RepID=A0A1Y1UTX8_9FUNG|nr:hypothetical protein BCR36DRAFT_416786 [Piromyces finnis]|eukprot:ORX41469.1 hypothetical protein BCR36DRAFT_416786 [Piromyces finnis]
MELDTENQKEIIESNIKNHKKENKEKKHKKKEKHLNENKDKKDKTKKEKKKEKRKEKENRKREEEKLNVAEENNNNKKRKLESNDDDKSHKKHKSKKDKHKKKDKKKSDKKEKHKLNLLSPEIQNSEIKENVVSNNNVKEKQNTSIPNDITSSKSSEKLRDNTVNSISNITIDNSKKANDNVENKSAEKENLNPELNININGNNNNNNNNNGEKSTVRRQDIHYKRDEVAEKKLKTIHENAPSELTSKWRKYENLKNTGLSIVMKKGPFSNEEKDILKKAVESYLEMHNIDKSLVLCLIFKRQYKDNNILDMKKHKDFWKYVSQSLPNRSTEASYKCVTRMYHPDNFNGKFTEKDDQEILRLYSIYGPSWKKIGEMIGRMGTAVKDRYNSIQTKSFTGYGNWTKEEDKLFKEIVNDLHSKNKFVDGMPLFTEVSKRMKTRSPKQCYDHWAFTRKDFVEGIKYPLTMIDRRNYLEKLSKLFVQDETNVDWKLVSDSSKPWKPFIYSRDFAKSKSKYIENTENMTFTECIKKMLNAVNEEISNDSNYAIVEERDIEE